MAIELIEIELNGMVHTIQTNSVDPANERFAPSVKVEEKAAPKPKNKAAKPSANKVSAVEDASDPDASE